MSVAATVNTASRRYDSNWRRHNPWGKRLDFELPMTNGPSVATQMYSKCVLVVKFQLLVELNIFSPEGQLSHCRSMLFDGKISNRHCYDLIYLYPFSIILAIDKLRRIYIVVELWAQQVRHYRSQASIKDEKLVGTHARRDCPHQIRAASFAVLRKLFYTTSHIAYGLAMRRCFFSQPSTYPTDNLRLFNIYRQLV